MKNLNIYPLAMTFALLLSMPGTFAHITTLTGAASHAESLSAVKAPDVFGFFLIKGTAPAGFKDIDHLNLGGSGEFGAGAKPPYYGQIRLNTRAKTDFRLLKPVQNGNSLSFKTKTVRGISYAFDGALARTDFGEPRPADDEVVLSGKLKKLKYGKVIAQSNVDFSWMLGD